MKRLAVAAIALAIAGVSAPAQAFHPMNQPHGYVMPKKWKRAEAPSWNADGYVSKKARRAAAAAQKRLDRKNRRAARLIENSDDDIEFDNRKRSVRASAPSKVSFSGYAKGSIVIDTAGRRLYYVLGGGRAYSYPVAVGKKGFAWSGTKRITRKQAWPDWRPPAEMRRRKPGLPVHMAGGPKNPLGAMALYLGSSLYRIHGTNDNSSIGLAVSSGCIRMRNNHVMHLSKMAGVGTTVHVLRRLPRNIAAKAGSSRSG